jgi:HORMA domain
MMRISVSSICYHRGIFEEDCFKSKPYDNLPIHQLDSAYQKPDGTITVRNNEAFMLTQWLERGVFHALELQYLNCLTFALCTKHPTTGQDILLEKYDFKVTYSGENGSATFNGVPIDSKEDLKNQAKKFLRGLIAFVETLDDLPSDRWITMMIKVIFFIMMSADRSYMTRMTDIWFIFLYSSYALLQYCDDAPDDYEPEYFRSCERTELCFGSVAPLKIKIGTIKTQHAAMNLTYAGLESLLMEDLERVTCRELVDDNASMSSRATEASCFRGTKKPTEVSGGDALALKLTKSLVIAPPAESDTAAILSRVREYM